MKTYILGGGTVFHVRPHLAISAPAYGSTARKLALIMKENKPILGLTKMAWSEHQGAKMIGETNQEVDNWIEANILSSKEPAIVFLNVAFCDYEGVIDCGDLRSGKDMPRLETKAGNQSMHLSPASKVLSKIRKTRKDIFLVAWKTTAGATRDEMFEKGLTLLKKNSCNLVFVNDLHTKKNMIVTPELAEYGYDLSREKALQEVVGFAAMRSNANFTRTTWECGNLLPIIDAPQTLQDVLSFCVENGAYEAFNGVTVGHFGFRDPNQNNVLWSSRRKQNYNISTNTDLCRVEIDQANNLQTVTTPVLGMKASAGARSQYLVLQKFPELDCIIHFHCPLKPSHDPRIVVRDQFPFECGSMQCGLNTAMGMVKIDEDLAVVMLDKHGPNICFSSKTDPKKVIKFILENFDLKKRCR